MYDKLGVALSALLGGTNHGVKFSNLTRTPDRPSKKAFGPQHTRNRIQEGINQHVKDLKREDMGMNFIQSYPQSAEDYNVGWGAPQVFSQTLPAGTSLPGIELNPNLPTAVVNPAADRVYGAKSLGGAISQQTQLGKFVNDANVSYANAIQKNPMLAKALLASSAIAPAAYSALVAGDEDTDESLLLASLPTAALPLANEALATYHGQKILDKSGLRTSLGQRGKLAGNLLSYLTVPLIAGSAGNFVGNIFDEDVPADM